MLFLLVVLKEPDIEFFSEVLGEFIVGHDVRLEFLDLGDDGNDLVGVDAALGEDLFVDEVVGLLVVLLEFSTHRREKGGGVSNKYIIFEFG